MVNVLIVDDSPLFRATVSRGLAKDPEINVVDTAYDPFDARDKILALHPDVMTLDVEMPNMNGIEFLKKLLPQYPMPVIVVSSATTRVFDAMSSGAVDFVAKPDGRPESLKNFMLDLAQKVKIAKTIRMTASGPAAMTVRTKMAESSPSPRKTTPEIARTGKFDGIVVIGASTGGTQATSKILNELPAKVPPIVIVQHMPPVFTRMYADSLSRTCKFPVKEAHNNDLVSPGSAIIAPGGDEQMTLYSSGGEIRVRLQKAPKVNGHCPSVDVIFESAANVMGRRAIGIILTGMGSDGAEGLLKMKRRGAYTIGQDEQSSVVYGMPQVAYAKGAVSKQLGLDSIAKHLLSIIN